MCRWMDLNELKLNHDKTEAMLIQQGIVLLHSINSYVLLMRACSLGVVFDNHMSFHARVKHL